MYLKQKQTTNTQTNKRLTKEDYRQTMNKSGRHAKDSAKADNLISDIQDSAKADDINKQTNKERKKRSLHVFFSQSFSQAPHNPNWMQPTATTTLTTNMDY